MTRKIKIEDKNTILVLQHGRIEDQVADIIVNWANSDMRSGPPSFFNIHKRAGIQLFNSVLTYEANMNKMRDCDTFTTVGGDLDCKLVLHVVVPLVKKSFVMAFRNMALTINEYMKENICRTMAIYIPEQADQCMVGIKEFLLDCGLKELRVLYLSDNEFNAMNNFFSKYEKKESLKNKFNYFIFNALSIIGSRRLIPKFLEDLMWNNKKRVKHIVEDEIIDNLAQNDNITGNKQKKLEKNIT